MGMQVTPQRGEFGQELRDVREGAAIGLEAGCKHQ
jgi:hypothetical protein